MLLYITLCVNMLKQFVITAWHIMQLLASLATYRSVSIAGVLLCNSSQAWHSLTISGMLSLCELQCICQPVCPSFNPQRTCAVRVKVLGLCVCWVFGEEKEDSPRLWEAYADLTACGCLVVQSVCTINC